MPNSIEDESWVSEKDIVTSTGVILRSMMENVAVAIAHSPNAPLKMKGVLGTYSSEQAVNMTLSIHTTYIIHDIAQAENANQAEFIARSHLWRAQLDLERVFGKAFSLEVIAIMVQAAEAINMSFSDLSDKGFWKSIGMTRPESSDLKIA